MSYLSDIRLRALDRTQENRSWAGEGVLGFNIYAYAGGDPINGADPSGLAPGDGAFRDGQVGSGPEGLGGSQSAGGVGVGGYGGGNAGGSGSSGAPGHGAAQDVMNEIVQQNSTGTYQQSDFSNASLQAALHIPAFDPNAVGIWDATQAHTRPHADRALLYLPPQKSSRVRQCLVLSRKLLLIVFWGAYMAPEFVVWLTPE